MRRSLLVATLLLAVPVLSAMPSTAAGQTLIVSPDHFTSIQAAVDAAGPGDTILVNPGVYQEEVIVTKPNLVLRGVDRESVILDGSGELANGVTVAVDGVSIESMTAQNYQSNGFFFSDVTGFRMFDLHAKNNGVYGLYAIHSTQGEISYSYAEGHGDGGLYIGETVHCNCWVHDNVAWNNMLGYSGTANSYVRITHNEFFDNRGGILMSVLPNEMGFDTQTNEVYGTQVHTEIAYNHVYNNNNKNVPESGIWETVHVPVGEGITISGGWFNDVHDNVVEGNALWGIGLFWLSTPPRGNVVHDNTISGSRYGIWWDEWGEDNCFEDNAIVDVDIISDPDPLPTCAPLVASVGCPPEVVDLVACRMSDVRAPSAAKDANLAMRALADMDPDQDLPEA